MNRDRAIEQLRNHGPSLRARGATSLYLFGSTVRDEARPRSDLDIFIDYDPRSRFNALDLVGCKIFLEEQLGVNVDVTTRDGLHPMLKAAIEREALQVF